MKKKDERELRDTCWNKAKEHEPIFVLLGRDKAAFSAIQTWADQRVILGLNKNDDTKIVNARQESWIMRDYANKEYLQPRTKKVDNNLFGYLCAFTAGLGLAFAILNLPGIVARFL